MAAHLPSKAHYQLIHTNQENLKSISWLNSSEFYQVFQNILVITIVWNNIFF